MCCLIAGQPERLKAEALGAYKQAIKSGVEMVACPEPADWSLEIDADILVDALLGTGVKGEPYGVIATAIERIDQLADEHLIVSIDMPSAMRVRSPRLVYGRAQPSCRPLSTIHRPREWF